MVFALFDVPPLCTFLEGRRFHGDSIKRGSKTADARLAAPITTRSDAGQDEGNNTKGDVVVEAAPGAAFKMVQAYLLLHFLVVALHAPAQLRQAHQGPPGGVGWP